MKINPEDIEVSTEVSLRYSVDLSPFIVCVNQNTGRRTVISKIKFSTTIRPGDSRIYLRESRSGYNLRADGTRGADRRHVYMYQEEMGEKDREFYRNLQTQVEAAFIDLANLEYGCTIGEPR